MNVKVISQMAPMPELLLEGMGTMTIRVPLADAMAILKQPEAKGASLRQNSHPIAPPMSVHLLKTIAGRRR